MLNIYYNKWDTTNIIVVAIAITNVNIANVTIKAHVVMEIIPVNTLGEIMKANIVVIVIANGNAANAKEDIEKEKIVDVDAVVEETARKK